MRVFRQLRAAMPGVVLLAGCWSSGTGPDETRSGRLDSLTVLPRALTASEQDGIRANNDFALRLLRATAEEEGGNVLLSPLSVSFALGLTMNGAADATLAEIRSTLGWPGRSLEEINMAYRDLATMLPELDTSITVRIANGIWVRSPLIADSGFVRDAARWFDAPVRSLATPRLMFDSVNAWGNRRTDGMVPQVLTGEPPDNLAMLVANAVYFLGTWRDRFDRTATRPMPFTASSGAAFPHPMMQRSGHFLGFRNERVVAAELPYGNTAYSMVLIMPNSDPAAKYASQLDTTLYNSVLRGMRPVDDRSTIQLPRFTVRRSLELKPMLQAMGMQRAFSDSAEFLRLVDRRVRLEFVRHGVTLEVDERGSRAAAVTVVGVGIVSAPLTFTFNRPFVFLIRERLSGTILFAGVLNDPRQ